MYYIVFKELWKTWLIWFPKEVMDSYFIAHRSKQRFIPWKRLVKVKIYSELMKSSDLEALFGEKLNENERNEI